MNASRTGRPYGEPDAEGFYLGAVRISHRAIRTMVAKAALATPGVAAIATASRTMTFGRPIPWQGIGLLARDQQVVIDLYLIAQRGANLAQTGARAQNAIVAAVEGLLGMQVSEINIYVQDVV